FGLGGLGQAPPPPADDPSLFELPPLIIDGIPTPVEKMTQAQLRAFIPLMLKYSMGYVLSRNEASEAGVDAS
ncbi:DNA-binding protein Ewg, partial [Operophtera brumata]